MGLKHSLALLLLDAFNRSDSERPLMLVGRSIEVLVRAVIYDDQVMIYFVFLSTGLHRISLQQRIIWAEHDSIFNVNVHFSYICS